MTLQLFTPLFSLYLKVDILCKYAKYVMRNISSRQVLQRLQKQFGGVNCFVTYLKLFAKIKDFITNFFTDTWSKKRKLFFTHEDCGARKSFNRLVLPKFAGSWILTLFNFSY